MNRPSVVIPLVAMTVIFGTVGQTMLKNAVNNVSTDSGLARMAFHLAQSPWFYGGVGFAGLGFLTWLFVLSRADLSYATPFLALAFPVILLSSVFILHEPIALLRIAGTLIVAIGMLMVAMS